MTNSQEPSTVSCSVQANMAFSFKNSAKLESAQLQATKNLKVGKGQDTKKNINFKR